MKKILHIALKDEKNPQDALESALISLGEYASINWMDIRDREGVDELRQYITNACIANNFDFVFMQIQTPDIIDIHTANVIKQTCGYVMSWNGDVRPELPPWQVELGKIIDMTALVTENYVGELNALGVKSCFLNIGFDEDLFTPQGVKNGNHDIVFLGSNYKDIFPLSQFRLDVVNSLRGKYGDRFACYGSGWQFKTEHVDKPTEASIYRGSKIALNLNHFDTHGRWSSDRNLRAMGSGCFMIGNYYPSIEKDFTNFENMVWFKTKEEMFDQIDYYLIHDEEREAIAKAGMELVHGRDTWAHRIGQIKKLLGWK